MRHRSKIWKSPPKKDPSEGDGPLVGAYENGVLRIIFLPAIVPARLIKLIELFNKIHNFRQENQGQSA